MNETMNGRRIACFLTLFFVVACGGSDGSGGAPGGNGDDGTGKGGSGGAGGAGGVVESGAGFPDPVNNGAYPSFQIDKYGARHLAYETVAANKEVRYGHCASSCASADNWQFVTLASMGLSGGYVRFALDSEDRPHLMWVKRESFMSDAVFTYARCEGDCASDSKAWKVVELPLPGAHGGSGSDWFTLDPSGRPRFLFTDGGGTHLGGCDSGCDDVANWWRRKLFDASSPEELNLAFDPAANAHIAFLNGNQLNFLACEGSCESLPADWIAIALGHSPRYAMRLHGSKVRIAYWDGFPGSEGDSALAEKSIHYAFCDSQCNQPERWGLFAIGAPEGHGQYGLDLALDPEGRPVIAYGDDTPRSVFVARCESDCEGEGAAWQSVMVDRTEELNDDIDLTSLLPAACGSPKEGAVYYWYPGYAPRVGLYPEGGVGVAYFAGSLFRCSQGGSVREGVQLVRVVEVGE